MPASPLLSSGHRSTGRLLCLVLLLALLLLLGLHLLLGIVVNMHGRFLTALCQRGLDGLHHVDLGVSFERRVQIALHRPSSARIVIEYHVVNAVESCGCGG